MMMVSWKSVSSKEAQLGACGGTFFISVWAHMSNFLTWSRFRECEFLLNLHLLNPFKSTEILPV